MDDENKQDFLVHSQQQAIANLMAAKASKIEKHMSKLQRQKLQRCTEKSTEFLSYASCFKLVWKKGKLLLGKRKIRTRKTVRRQKKSTDMDGIEVAKMQMDTVYAIQQQQSFYSYSQVPIQPVPQTEPPIPSPVGLVADWLTNFVQTIKEPKVIGDGKFNRPKKNLTSKTNLPSKPVKLTVY